MIHVSSGLKADVIVARDSPHDDSRFARVLRIAIPDGRLEPFASPEDVILKKLECFHEGGSEKHLRDIASTMAVRGVDCLDWTSIEHWAVRLGIATELARVRPSR